MGIKWAGERYVRPPRIKRIGFSDPTKCYRCQEPVIGPPHPRCTAPGIHTEPKRREAPRG